MGWLWLAALLEIILYISIAISILSSRFSAANGGVQAPTPVEGRGRKKMLTIAFYMIGYPIIFIIVVIPLGFDQVYSLSRPRPGPQVTKYDLPFVLIATSLVLFALSGFFNVLLYTITRPNLIGHHEVEDESVDVDGYLSGRGSSLPETGSTSGAFSKERVVGETLESDSLIGTTVSVLDII